MVYVRLVLVCCLVLVGCLFGVIWCCLVLVWCQFGVSLVLVQCCLLLFDGNVPLFGVSAVLFGVNVVQSMKLHPVTCQLPIKINYCKYKIKFNLSFCPDKRNG